MGVIIIFIGVILFAIMLMRLGGISKKINMGGILLLMAVVLTFIPTIEYIIGIKYIIGVVSLIPLLIILVLVYIGSLILIHIGSGESMTQLRRRLR